MEETMEDLQLMKTMKHRGVVEIKTIGDGSCFFHCILLSYYIPYRESSKSVRKQMAKKLREDLAHYLPNKYNIISNGVLSSKSKEFGCSLETMKKELSGEGFVGNLYNEYISDILNIDIYVISKKTGDLYTMGTDINLIIKNRNSIVLIYSEDMAHYSLLGIEQNNDLATLFSPEHPFIENIKKRYNELLRTRRNY